MKVAALAARGAIGGLKDSLLEIKDSVVKRQEAPEELIAAETPDDRWWAPRDGWPKAPAPFPAALTPEGVRGCKGL